jgi:hypothetical protein
LEKRRRNVIVGSGGLQPVEIPQNRQSFLWKSLAKTSLILEMLGKMQGGAPLFRRLRLAARSNGILASQASSPPAETTIARASGNDHCEGTNGFRI